ncbi:MAG: hypothetical protein DRM98_04185, partial [Thermoplasmata archaeon]
MKNKILALLIGIVVIVILVAIFSGQKAKEEMIKVGAILPLSGKLSFLGVSEINGIKLAVRDFEKEYPDIRIKLIVEDSKGDPKEAATIANKLIFADKVDVIFSALSPVSSAVVPITRKSKTLTILISVLSPSFAKEGETVFKFYPDITAFASKFAEFLSLRSVTKAGLLIYNVEPGERFIEKFSELFKGEIVGIERFNREDSEFKTQLLKLKAKSPEAIVFIGYPINDIYFLSQLVEMDFKPLVLLQLANYPPVNKGAKEALKILKPISTWYTFLKEKNLEFVSRYKEMYETEPDAEAGYSYDAMKVFLECIKLCGKDKNCIIRKLKSMEFSGVVSKIITFDSDGNAILPVDLI